MIKTTSLETSKLLKETGFRQDSYFFWGKDDTGFKLCPAGHEPYYLQVEWLASPTTDELLEELPAQLVINKKVCGLRITKDYHIDKNNHSIYQVWYQDSRGNSQSECFISHKLPLIELLAKCWIYLKKEGLL